MARAVMTIAEEDPLEDESKVRQERQGIVKREPSEKEMVTIAMKCRR